ncbi:peptidase M15 family protein [Rhizobium etli bv. phaseoli str. IE4803]|nr:peptidase M15 family protein [Rhizobium etli bv. phaseoli str. IE4803]
MDAEVPESWAELPNFCRVRNASRLRPFCPICCAAGTCRFCIICLGRGSRPEAVLYPYGERGTITYKRDGKFDPKGLAQINRFLRDWRRNEPTRMDPRLLDLVWEVYKRSGGKDYIHVVSAYRSPATNNMLRNRSRSTGVAKKSQHMLGKAMDFYFPSARLGRRCIFRHLRITRAISIFRNADLQQRRK